MAKQQFRSGDSQIAGLYDLGETLGCGHFAVVKIARHVFTGERVAVKVIDKTKLDEIAKAHLFKEITCMKLVQHPNVVRLYEVIDTKTKLYLVQELGDGGDMYDYIMNHERGLNEEKARHYFRQIVQAIDYCHKLHVVHRDLKPENVIFFKNQDIAKLTDFGFSNKFSPGQMLETSCGSLAYSAPEVLLGDAYHAPAVDIWSLGVILYMLVCGRAPFNEVNDSETLMMIMDVKYAVPDHVSAACKNLISKMLVKDPQRRITLEAMMSDPWLLLVFDPVIPTPVPLVTQLGLTAEEYKRVVDKMEAGNIADRETIKRSLEENAYDHIAATYYLLAEQCLRRLKAVVPAKDAHPKKRRKGRLSLPENSYHAMAERKQRFSSEDKENGSGNSTDSSSGSSSARSSSGRLAPREGHILDKIVVAHAIEAEEVLHSSMEEDDCNAGLRSTHKAFRSLPSLPAQQTNASSQYSTEDMIRPAHVPPVRQRNRGALGHTPLSKAKSTPLLLNQIFEERESDLEDSPAASPRVERNRKPNMGGLVRAKRDTRHHSPVPPSGSRRSSCSSSDEDELEKHMRRLKTSQAPAGCRKPNSRRRNCDDDEGDDGTGCGGGHGGLDRMGRASSRNSSNNDGVTKSESSCKQGPGGKTNCLTLSFTPVEKHSLASIDESNKENISENVCSDIAGNTVTVSDKNAVFVSDGCKITTATLELNEEEKNGLDPKLIEDASEGLDENATDDDKKTTLDSLKVSSEKQNRLARDMAGDGGSYREPDAQTNATQDADHTENTLGTSRGTQIGVGREQDGEENTSPNDVSTTQDTLRLNRENQKRLSVEANGDEGVQHSGKRSPLIEDCRRSSSFLRHERKGSAVKYIHHCTCEDNRTLEGTCKCHAPSAQLDCISMNIRKKEASPVGSGQKTLRVLKHPSVANVSSTCCQIF